LSNSVLKPFGIRGSSSPALQRGQGAPAAPQVQACSPSQGLSGWLSHIHPQSWQSEHFMACPAYPDFCHESSSRSIRPCLGFGSKRFGQARRVSSGNRRASGLFFPAEIRANVGTFPSASLASEARLDIGQPDIIRPAVAADCRRMAAPVVRAIDQETANARGAHFSEGDLLLAG
jgi:hypothetical protein